MAMNPEQLTARINDLVDENRSIQQELAKRAMEHQGQHTMMASLQVKLASFEEALEDIARNAGNPFNARAGPLRGGATPEMQKRLDRWATDTGDVIYGGSDGNVSVMEWSRNMKERASYCSDALC